MPKDVSPRRPRFLLGQLSANGDCLYATTVARQIKADHPDCHLTWAVSSGCRRILDGNPHVDEVWEFAPLPGETSNHTWRRFAPEARRRKRRGDFDEIYFTQVAPDHYYRSDGAIRSTILRGYPGPITVPVTPVLCLSQTEQEHARRFAEDHGLARYRHVVLFECSPKSAQSHVNPQFALRTAARLVASHPEACVILSSNLPLPFPVPGIVDGSVLSLRETAALTRYCSLLIGCSSGITWIGTSSAATLLPMVQLLGADYEMSASVINDFERWSLPTDAVIEMTTWDQDHVVHCVETIFAEGVAAAKARFGQRPPPLSTSYYRLLRVLLHRREFTQAVLLLCHTLWRPGPRGQVLSGTLRIVAGLGARRLRKILSAGPRPASETGKQRS